MMMIEIKETAVFSNFITYFGDDIARAKIVARIRRLAGGNPGDVTCRRRHFRIAHSPRTRIPRLLHATRQSACYPALRRRQVNAAKRHRTGQTIGE